MDAVLHAARAEPGARRMRRWRAHAGTLPDGTFVVEDGMPALLGAGAAHPFLAGMDGWSYGAPVRRPVGEVEVLTPRPTVEVLRAGYRVGRG
jgi:hypothetical protein